MTTIPPRRLSDHFDGERFFDPEGQPENKSLGDLLDWKFRTTAADWPKHRPPVPHEPVRERVEAGDLRVTFVGHATVLIQTDGLNLLTDPFWSERASPFSWIGPKRTTPPGLPFEALPPIDAVLVSHNHFDHMDLATLRRLDETFAPRVVVPLGNARYLEGFEGEIDELDWDAACEPLPGLRVTALRTRHWSHRQLRDRNKALWAAFALRTKTGTIYFGGDTAFHSGSQFDEALQKAGPFRLAILPIGAYAPRDFMRDQHMTPEEAADAHERLGRPPAMAIHHETIQLTNEPMDEPRERLTATGAKNFRVLAPGESWDVVAG